ncbi:hypothetical protein ONE63_000498 [Megalurothrips usitatus]|uniref:Arb2 domain-containing protein n=1 Tax=Megalurothrips usitatus TaxID=439358 RepID=A0AAV7Y5F1_9NEOP|nr:hypothetical protein ONE63_000498 [Megalurothrips usitatus]
MNLANRSLLLSRLLLVLRVSSATMSGSCSAPSSTSKFPTSLQGFGYAFNEDGKLCQLDPATGKAGCKPFVFNVSEDHSFNQQRYEALGDLITEYVYDLLSNEVGLQKWPVPKGGDPSSFIFATEDALTNPDKLMVLIHGSGVVRAGQWARSLIINDNIKSGTQIPYIERARALGYAVLVLNTNDNVRVVGDERIPIKGSSSPIEHATWVWENYVKQAKAKKIAVVAHSFGGFCAVELAGSQFEDFSSRVFAIALTDSVHTLHRLRNVKSKNVKEYLCKVGRNWVSSSEPLDELIDDIKNEDIIAVSAGHKKHEMTSWSCIDSLFKYVEERYHSDN